MTAIVFIHGFMGKKEQFTEVIEQLGLSGREADVICHTLPGHGGGLRQFRRHGAEDWQRSVDELLDGLRVKYDRIILVGHSMGGLLAVCSAAENCEKIQCIYAVSLPLRLRLTLEGVCSRIRSVRQAKPGESPQVKAAREMCGVDGITAFNSPLLLGRCIHLLRVIGMAKRALPKLDTPLWVINSQKDDIVSPASVRLAQRLCPGAQASLLSRASHFWFPKEESKIIAELIEKALP